MILVTRRDADGNPVTWIDVGAREVHDISSGVEQVRPFTDAENTTADAFLDAHARSEAATGLREQLAAGIDALIAARDAADADIPVAEGLHATATAAHGQAVTQRAQVAGWTPSPAYQPGDLVAVRDQLAAVLDRQAAILTALADIYTYRAAVDRNAVTTDESLLWLARLASGLLD